MSYIQHLTCSECGREYSSDQPQTFCTDCVAPLLVRYDLPAIKDGTDRDELVHRPAGMWRWHEVLPVRTLQHRLTLGEGDAPLLKLDRLGRMLGLNNLYCKEEGCNPTGSFKARGLAVAVSKARELGLSRLIIPTAGNAGGALAAYAARGGMQACVVMPMDTPKANIDETRIAGAEVILVEGLISDAARLVGEKARAEGWFDVSTFKEPYRTEGKKIMGYELAEAFSWYPPQVIIYPTGGGTGLVGMWKAFAEMAELGWLESIQMPRFVAVQAEGCAPVVQAFHDGKKGCEFWQGAHTIASGLRVPKSFADREILRNLRQSQGTAVAVSDVELTEAQKRLAEVEGIFAAPEGAATLAALEKLIQQGWVTPDENVVIFNTATGLKYLQ